PLPQISFCPTGGITPQNAESYLSLPNVVCAGGSWTAPKNLVQTRNWNAIKNLANEASKFGRTS
ncbi:keto-deoxy-phosphogluconate aldolase, partial [Leisingera sp. JC11]